MCPHDCDRIYSSYSSFKHHIQWHKQQTEPAHRDITQEYVFTELDDVFQNDYTTAGNEEEEDDDFPFYEGVTISEEYDVSIVRPQNHFSFYFLFVSQGQAIKFIGKF